MPKRHPRPWTNDQLREAIARAGSYAAALAVLQLEPEPGLRQALMRDARALGVDTTHFSRHPDPQRGRKRRWTDDQLRDAIAASISISEVLRRLGLIPAGGNYTSMHTRIRELGIDTSHFLGGGWNRGLEFQPSLPRPIEDVLVANRPTSSQALKRRLIKAGLKTAACELCGWATAAPDGRVPVELDHINGDKDDNRLENLRILCPNCHALQPTHRGLNQRRARRRLASPPQRQ